ncbi:MAG: hypothetical protein ACO2Z8_08710, partial [Burkholderiaceae bacterium]
MVGKEGLAKNWLHYTERALACGAKSACNMPINSIIFGEKYFLKHENRRNRLAYLGGVTG